MIPGIVIKAGGLTIFTIRQKPHTVGAFEQQSGAVRYAAKVCPVSTRYQFVLPYPAGRWAVDGGGVNGNTHAHGLGCIARAAVVDRVHIGQTTFVASNSAAAGATDKVADQIANIGVGDGIFGDGT